MIKKYSTALFGNIVTKPAARLSLIARGMHGCECGKSGVFYSPCKLCVHTLRHSYESQWAEFKIVLLYKGLYNQIPAFRFKMLSDMRDTTARVNAVFSAPSLLCTEPYLCPFVWYRELIYLLIIKQVSTYLPILTY